MDTKSTATPVAQSVEAGEYTDCISAEGFNPLPTNVLDIALNNLMVRFH